MNERMKGLMNKEMIGHLYESIFSYTDEWKNECIDVRMKRGMNAKTNGLINEEMNG